MKGWYKTSDGTLHEFEAPYGINLNNKGIIELVIPDGVKEVSCYDNYLTELVIPDQVELIYCWNNKLTELIVPDDCKVLCDKDVQVITRTELRSKRLKAILK
jgi:hypothetical protein